MQNIKMSLKKYLLYEYKLSMEFNSMKRMFHENFHTMN